MKVGTHNNHSVVFENVSKVFGERGKQATAINNVSFAINAGELVTLLGPSGCGKTTILRMIAGLEFSTSGKIIINNKNVTEIPATDRDVSMVFQSYALFPHMNVMENVGYGLSVSGKSKSEIAERSNDALTLVGMVDYASRYPAELSGGQQQRVAIARALVLEPSVLLLDEPLSNLDAKLRRKVRTEIRDLQQKLELTAVYVTHDQEEALAVSDTIIVMQKAEVSQMGTPNDLYERPQNGFIADFIGNANLLSATLIGSSNAVATVNVFGYQFDVPHVEALNHSEEVILAVKPEAMNLQPIEHESSSTTFLSGIVTHVTYLGKYIEYLIEGVFGTLYVIKYQFHDLSNQNIKVNTAVAITFNRQGVIIINK